MKKPSAELNHCSIQRDLPSVDKMSTNTQSGMNVTHLVLAIKVIHGLIKLVWAMYVGRFWLTFRLINLMYILSISMLFMYSTLAMYI